MKNCYNILLDDERTPSDVYFYKLNEEYKNLKWEIAKDYDDFIKMFIDRYIIGELPCVISFDHDLVDEHYKLGAKKLFMSFDEDKVKTPTGYHALLWLLNFYESNDIVLPKIMIHTKNTAGAENMKSLLRDYETRNEINKWKP